MCPANGMYSLSKFLDVSFYKYRPMCLFKYPQCKICKMIQDSLWVNLSKWHEIFLKEWYIRSFRYLKNVGQHVSKRRKGSAIKTALWTEASVVFRFTWGHICYMRNLCDFPCEMDHIWCVSFAGGGARAYRVWAGLLEAAVLTRSI